MDFEQINGELLFQLRNISLSGFLTDSDYEDIVSPFTRIYLITQGSGFLIIGKSKIELEEGFLYLIPSYTSCTYHFKSGLAHYYLHASIDFLNGLSPYSLYPVKYKVAAVNLDTALFQRILELNPDIKLPHHHPDIYQTKQWLNRKVVYKSPAHYLETVGIMQQLFSRFVEPQQMQTLSGMLKYNIQTILLYIQNNLQSEITVDHLAGMACLSRDHFAKVFKSIMGFSPMDYVIRKRVERAQFLLVTTKLAHKEIIEKAGFRSVAYFSRIFRKVVGYTPEEYRKMPG